MLPRGQHTDADLGDREHSSTREERHDSPFRHAPDRELPTHRDHNNDRDSEQKRQRIRFVRRVQPASAHLRRTHLTPVGAAG